MIPPRMPHHAVCVALELSLGVTMAFAQEMRDPTVAPGTPSAMPGLATAGSEGMTVLVRDGKPYLVVGTRLYGVGDTVGIMRVDRITESEVWLHDGRTLIKAPRFAGIQRTAVADKSACAPKVVQQPKRRDKAAQPPEPTSAAASAPCEDTQP